MAPSESVQMFGLPIWDEGMLLLPTSGPYDAYSPTQSGPVASPVLPVPVEDLPDAFLTETRKSTILEPFDPQAASYRLFAPPLTDHFSLEPKSGESQTWLANIKDNLNPTVHDWSLESADDVSVETIIGGTIGPGIDAVCDELEVLVKDFLQCSGENATAEARMLFFWDLGRVLLERRRDYYGFTHDSFYRDIANRLATSPFGHSFRKEFSPGSLADMQRLSCVFPRAYLERIIKTIHIASGGVWNHLRAIIKSDDPLERLYYAEMSYQCRWDLTTLREYISRSRFHTHTIMRQPDELVQNAFVQLSHGNFSEWIYRDLMRFDFLNLKDEDFQSMMEVDFEAKIMAVRDDIRKEFGEGFTIHGNQVRKEYLDVDGTKSYVKVDILGYVNDGVEHYPLIVELKMVPFSKAVLLQCLKDKHVWRGYDGEGRPMLPGYLKDNEKRVLVMALVPKFDHEFEKVMEVGMRGDGRRSSIFAALFAYQRPTQKFLEKAIGAQLRLSETRAERERSRLSRLENGSEEIADQDTAELFQFILNPEASKNSAHADTTSDPNGDPKLPF